MVLNPFLEGVIVILLAIGSMVLGHAYIIPELTALGSTLVGLGLGYMGGISVQRSKE